MNNIKKILEEQEKEFDKKLEDSITAVMRKFSKLNRGYLSELEIASGTIAKQWIKDNKKFIKSFRRQSQKTLIKVVIDELVREEKGADNYKIYEDETIAYSSEDIGYNQAVQEAKAKGEEIIKALEL